MEEEDGFKSVGGGVGEDVAFGLSVECPPASMWGGERVVGLVFLEEVERSFEDDAEGGMVLEVCGKDCVHGK